MTHPKRFIEYYLKSSYAKPELNAFLLLNFNFRLGVYIDFLKTENIVVIVSNLGFKIRKYNIPTDVAKIKDIDFIYEEFYDGKQVDIIVSYHKAIEKAFDLIINPF